MPSTPTLIVPSSSDSFTESEPSLQTVSGGAAPGPAPWVSTRRWHHRRAGRHPNG